MVNFEKDEAEIDRKLKSLQEPVKPIDLDKPTIKREIDENLKGLEGINAKELEEEFNKLESEKEPIEQKLSSIETTNHTKMSSLTT